MNTMLNVSADRKDTDAAARLCADLVQRGYRDWYLPSKEELNLMYTNLHSAGLVGFESTSRFYWSSTEFSSTNTWNQNFFNGTQLLALNKSSNYGVRAVRAF